MALLLVPLILVILVIAGILVVGTVWWLVDFIRMNYQSS